MISILTILLEPLLNHNRQYERRRAQGSCDARLVLVQNCCG